MKKVIVFKSFCDTVLCGKVNLTRGTKFGVTVNKEDNREYVCFPSGQLIVATFSQNFVDYFAYNDDGYGLLRGDLTSFILSQKFNKEQIDILKEIWPDYLMPYPDTLLFSNYFYVAPINDLVDMADSLGLMEGKQNYG